MTLFLILTTGISFSQSPSKKDSKIIIKPTDTTNLLTRITIALFEAGYSPAFKDEQSKIIVSTTKIFDFGSYSVKIRAIIKDSVIVFSGQENFRSRGLNELEDIYFEGAKGSYRRLAWDQIDLFAKSFGQVVRYSK